MHKKSAGLLSLRALAKQSATLQSIATAWIASLTLAITSGYLLKPLA